MERYALISTKMPREFVLLQGTGCRWARCTFCDYHKDVSEEPYAVNAPVLDRVSGRFGVLDIINSGSAPELDEQTVSHIKRVVSEKNLLKKATNVGTSPSVQVFALYNLLLLDCI